MNMKHRWHGVPHIALLLTLMVATWPAAAAETAQPLLQQARAAAAAGDSERAIALYDQALVAAPNDVLALAESAQQLSWLGRYDASLERYDRALALDPSSRFALLERAKVLSWAKRYSESIDAFDRLLARDPDDLDARLGRARALSWSGQLTAARGAYQAILDDHPGQADALLGIAQTHAWGGALGEARRGYGAANLALGGRPDAEVGLAYLDLWEGSPMQALKAAERLAARHPGNGDVRELVKAAHRATAPWIAAGWSQMDDTDHNLLTLRRVEAGTWLPIGLNTRLVYSDYDVRTAGTRGDITSLQAFAGWMPRPRHHLEAMLGVDRLGRPAQPGKQVSDFGLAYHFPLGAAWSGWVGAQREPYRYSVPLIDNRIVIDSVVAGVNGRMGDNWLGSAEVSRWQLSDDNERLAVDLSARRRWKAGDHKLEAGIGLRWLDWRDDLDNGYFDPSGFKSMGLLGRAYGPLTANGRATYDLSIEAGMQSFDASGRRTTSDPYYLVVGRASWQATDSLRLEIFGEAGSYASEGSEDWRYARAGARFVWQFGARRQP